MKLLILGGTGFVGRHLVDAALVRGHRVTMFNRGQTAPSLFPGVETILGDREVSHAPLKNGRWDAVIDTNARMPRVAKAAATLLKDAVGHYTFVSSVSAYAGGMQSEDQGEGSACDEASLLEPFSAADIDDREMRTYGARKAACERWIADEVGARLLVIRPGLVVGPYDGTDRFTYWPVRLAEGGDVLSPGDGSDGIRFIDARDHAAWVVSMVERGATGAFNAVGPEAPLTMGALLQECRKVCNPAARLVWASAKELLRLKVEAWSDMPVWAPGLRPVSCRKAVAAGLTFRALEDTIRDTLAWALAAKKQRPLKAGLDPVREREVLASLRLDA